MINLIPTGLHANAQTAAPLSLLMVSPDSIDQALRLSSIKLVVTTCAVAGNRTHRFSFVDDNNVHVLDLSFVPVQTASTTCTYQAIQNAALSAAFVQNAAQCPLPSALLPYGYRLICEDTAAIAANYETGGASSSSSTTLTDSGASWTVDEWIGYTAQMGLDVTLVVTSNTDTVLTGTGAWSDLVAGTAEDSTATTLTDSDASWTTDTWVGWTVEMDSSTARISSNTATVLTIDAWSPLAPTTGAYKIYGPYSILGDTGVLTTTATQMNRVDS